MDGIIIMYVLEMMIDWLKDMIIFYFIEFDFLNGEEIIMVLEIVEFMVVGFLL